MKCSIIKHSFLNGNNDQVIFSFPPNIVPFSRISQEPKQVVYFPVSNTSINEIRIWLTDQHSIPISLNSEIVTVRLHFKSS